MKPDQELVLERELDAATSNVIIKRAYIGVTCDVPQKKKKQFKYRHAQSSKGRD